jgi:hypothetical protein
MCFERQELTPTPKRPRPGAAGATGSGRVDLDDRKDTPPPSEGTGCCK